MVQAEVADRLAAPPGTPDVRRAVGEGGLVRRRAPGRGRRPHRVLAGAQRRLRAGRAGPAGAAGDAPAAPRSSPWSTPRSRSAARRCGRRWPAGPARRGGRDGAARRRRRPEAARRGARRRRVRPAGAHRAAAVPRHLRSVRRRVTSVAVRSRPGQGQPAARGRRARARDGYHDSRRSSTRCRCTTRSSPSSAPTTCRSASSDRRRAPRRRPAGRAQPGRARRAGCWPSTPASSPASACTSTRASRSPAAWPAAARTPPGPWWPATRCGDRAVPRRAARARRRAGQRRAVRAARRHRRWAPAAASG